MTGPAGLRGVVYSHTTIRVAAAAHAAEGPFVVLVVETEDGRRVLGRLAGPNLPSIGSPVVEIDRRGQVPVFASIV